MPLLAAEDPESPAARERRLEWFRHDKYGLFIHWGLYAIPAGFWKGERSPGIGEWVQHRLKIPVTEYATLTQWFNPIRFDADAWAQLAHDFSASRYANDAPGTVYVVEIEGDTVER